MTNDKGTESISSNLPSQFSWLKVVWHRFSVRLLLVLGVMIFFTVVAVDSLQPATAADMTGQASPLRDAAVTSSSSVVELESADAPLDVSGTYLEFNTETAHRLQHSDLLSPQLTRSRLTRAHLLPSSQR